MTVSAATVGVDETPGVQTTGGATRCCSVRPRLTFNGGSTTVAALFSGIANKGVDPDVSGASLDNGALSFASSGASSIVSVGTLTYGADGPAASGSETFNLSLLKTTSNLTLTDGEAITLSQSGNMILGTVTGGGAFSGQVAYAITMDPLTGKVYVADYLSLHQDSLTTTPNDGLALTSGTIGVTVTLTDGDGDQVTSTVTDISGQISFFDDGPTAPTVTVSAATVGVDETPGVQTTGGATDVLGSTAITFNGGSTTVAALFSGIANKGVDPDVSGGLKDNGALSFASSGASSIVSVGTLTYGADGPAASGSETFNLSLLKTTSNLTLTDGEAITLSQSGNMILGTVTGGGAFSGQVAYAITMDPLTGKVYVADYLSLQTRRYCWAAGGAGGDRCSRFDRDYVQRASTTVAALFTSVANKGVDPDVSTLDNGALSFASSTGDVLNTQSLANANSERQLWRGRSGGGDRPVKYAFSILNASPAGLALTDGEAITLSQSGNMILGTVTGGGAISGQVAYAIAIDPLDGPSVRGGLSVAASGQPDDHAERWSGADVWHDWRDGDADRRRRRPGHLDGDRHQRPDQLLRRWSDGADGDGERGDGWC